MKISADMSGVERRALSARRFKSAGFCPRPSTLVPRPSSGFTLVEIAISLAVIGIALVAILGVLPLGLNVQRDNREETLVDQDATVFLENIRNGTHGLDDLTNYVYAITNFWTSYDDTGKTNSGGSNGYTYTAATAYGNSVPVMELTNGANIIGLLTTPEYTDTNGAPIPSLIYGGYSNHVVAYVRSLSGPASEKPPQTNAIVLGDAFSYKMICNNVPVAVNTPPVWNDQNYNAGDEVFWNGVSWRAIVAGTPPLPPQLDDEPGISVRWAQDSYIQQLDANLHELRLTFLWPLLPTGNTGNGRHTFATTVAGQIVTNIPSGGQILYFFQPQSFTSAP